MSYYDQNFDDFIVLQSSYNGELPFKKITVTISVSTTEDEYRCREIDDTTETKEILDEDGYPCYQHLSDRDAWSEIVSLNSSHREMSTLIPLQIGEEIANLFFTRCTDGKYPDTFIYLDREYYKEGEYDRDTDKGRGHLYAEYTLLVHLL